MSDKCEKCRAPVVRDGDRVQFDSSQYHMDAVKKLSEISALRAEIERLTRIVQDFDNLIGDSGGVYGLHLNGDLAPWSEIMPGGRFEEWLIHYGDPIIETTKNSNHD